MRIMCMHIWCVCTYTCMHGYVHACICVYMWHVQTWHVYDAGDVCTVFNTKNILVYCNVAD